LTGSGKERENHETTRFYCRGGRRCYRRWGNLWRRDQQEKHRALKTAMQAPAVNKGLLEWRMVTTWPKNFPELGTGANVLGELITKGSGGRLTVKVFGAKEIVPAFESLDAVANGTVQMGHGAPYYWKGKVAASQFLASIPFGMTAQEVNAWYQWETAKNSPIKSIRKWAASSSPAAIPAYRPAAGSTRR
jgi:TRAP-type mannitol/chloroaromatic compound transport system substrate-binding protein